MVEVSGPEASSRTETITEQDEDELDERYRNPPPYFGIKTARGMDEDSDDEF